MELVKIKSPYFDKFVHLIESIEEYKYSVNLGFEPLSDWKRFHIEFKVRIDIQNNLFGKTELGKFDTVKANEKYYKFCFHNKLQVCEECSKPLTHYWAGYISHILSRGSSAELAHDPRNSRILCEVDHPLAENTETHVLMKIYPIDELIINILKHEYKTSRSNI